MINIAVIKYAFPHLLRGAQYSVIVAVLSCCIGMTLGILVGFMHVSRNSMARALAACYVGLIRGTPMLIQITFLYYALLFNGIIFSELLTAVIAIGFNSGAYISEAVRAGIRSVSSGQIEAARALGLSPLSIIRFVVMPQAFRVMLPSLGNELVTLIKDSSLASIIGVAELYHEARHIISQTYDVISIYAIIALFYLVLTTSVSLIVRLIERKMSWYVKN